MKVEFYFEDCGETASCEIEELEGDWFRIVKVYRNEAGLKVRCRVCGSWKSIREVRYLGLDGWRLVPICSEECYLALCIRRHDE